MYVSETAEQPIVLTLTEAELHDPQRPSARIDGLKPMFFYGIEVNISNCASAEKHSRCPPSTPVVWGHPVSESQFEWAQGNSQIRHLSGISPVAAFNEEDSQHHSPCSFPPSSPSCCPSSTTSGFPPHPAHFHFHIPFHFAPGDAQ